MVLFNTVEEKVSYVKALLYIASLDEKVDDSEVEALNSICRLYNIPEEYYADIWNSVNGSSDIKKILEPIVERNIKLMLINDLISLCFADGRYTDVEKKGIRNISKLLNIEESKVLEFEAIMEENILLRKKLFNALEWEG